eukprot:5509482-Prymnesium_polylepis.2
MFESLVLAPIGRMCLHGSRFVLSFVGGGCGAVRPAHGVLCPAAPSTPPCTYRSRVAFVPWTVCAACAVSPVLLTVLTLCGLCRAGPGAPRFRLRRR